MGECLNAEASEQRAKLIVCFGVDSSTKITPVVYSTKYLNASFEEKTLSQFVVVLVQFGDIWVSSSLLGTNEKFTSWFLLGVQCSISANEELHQTRLVEMVEKMAATLPLMTGAFQTLHSGTHLCLRRCSLVQFIGWAPYSV